MDLKEMIIQYLFYYNHTVCPTININDDITNLCEYMNEYENSDFDFKSWIKDNDLEEEYKEYRKYI